MHRWLHDARRLHGARGARGAPRGRGAPEVGAREVRVERHGGAEHDVRNPAVAPLDAEQRLQFRLRPQGRHMTQPDRDEGRVPGPLMGIQAAGGDGGRSRPVAVEHLGGPDVQRAGGPGGIVYVGGGVGGLARTGRRGGAGGAHGSGDARAADGESGCAVHSGLPEDVRSAGSVPGTVGLRLFNTQNSICNAELGNARGRARPVAKSSGPGWTRPARPA